MGCICSKSSRKKWTEEDFLGPRPIALGGARRAPRELMMDLWGSDDGNYTAEEVVAYHEYSRERAAVWEAPERAEMFEVPFLRTKLVVATGTTRSQPSRPVQEVESGWASTRSAPPVSRVGRSSQLLRDIRRKDGLDEHAMPSASMHIWHEAVLDYKSRHKLGGKIRLPEAVHQDMLVSRDDY